MSKQSNAEKIYRLFSIVFLVLVNFPNSYGCSTANQRTNISHF